MEDAPVYTPRERALVYATPLLILLPGITYAANHWLPAFLAGSLAIVFGGVTLRDVIHERRFFDPYYQTKLLVCGLTIASGIVFWFFPHRHYAVILGAIENALLGGRILQHVRQDVRRWTCRSTTTAEESETVIASADE